VAGPLEKELFCGFPKGAIITLINITGVYKAASVLFTKVPIVT